VWATREVVKWLKPSEKNTVKAGLPFLVQVTSQQKKSIRARYEVKVILRKEFEKDKIDVFSFWTT
jgi:hypothetical protein